MRKLFNKLFNKDNRKKIVESFKYAPLFDSMDVAETFISKPDEFYVKMN